MTKSVKHTVDHFIEQMGMATHREGMPRIAGQILGLLLIEAGPFSFSELALRLEVRRGSVSTNTRFLEGLGMIERVSKKGDRCDYFQLAHDPYSKLLQGSSQRIMKSLSIVKEAREGLPASWSDSIQRLESIERFYTGLLESHAELLEKLKSS